MTKELQKKIPMLGGTAGRNDSERDAVVKFFGGAWTWYATEGAAILADGTEVALGSIELPRSWPDASGAGDGEVVDVRFFGFVESGLGSDCDEWGYFSLREIETVRFPPFGLPVERDLYWKPQPVPVRSAR